jgi:hypothetical protein
MSLQFLILSQRTEHFNTQLAELLTPRAYEIKFHHGKIVFLIVSHFHRSLIIADKSEAFLSEALPANIRLGLK